MVLKKIRRRVLLLGGLHNEKELQTDSYFSSLSS